MIRVEFEDLLPDIYGCGEFARTIGSQARFHELFRANIDFVCELCGRSCDLLLQLETQRVAILDGFQKEGCFLEVSLFHQGVRLAETVVCSLKVFLAQELLVYVFAIFILNEFDGTEIILLNQ